MMQGDRDFADKARALIEVGRALDEPSPADRERVRARLSAALGAASALTAPRRAAAESGTSPGLQGAPTGLSTIKLVSSLGLALTLSMAGVGLVRTLRSARDERPSAVRASPGEPGESTARAAHAPETGRAALVSRPAASTPSAAEAMPDAPRDAKAVGSPLAVVSRRRAVIVRRELGRASDARVAVGGLRAAERGEGMGANAEVGTGASATSTGTSTASMRTASTGAMASTAADVQRSAATAAHAEAVQAAANTQPAPATARPDAQRAAASHVVTTPAHAEAPRAAAARAPTLAGELALLDAAQGALARGEFQRALQQLDQHAARYPSGSLAPERSAARAVTLCRLQRRSDGLRELQRLQSHAPSSPLLAWVREACGIEQP
jgi:hypothetical protein